MGESRLWILQIVDATPLMISLRKHRLTHSHTHTHSLYFPWYRQLGHNDRVNKLKPTLVQALEGIFVTQITCGWSHSVALTAKGRIYTWGNSDHGCVIVMCPNLTNCTPFVRKRRLFALAHSLNFSPAPSFNRKLGHGSGRKVSVPQLVEKVKNYRVIKVASYNEHTAALVEPLDNSGCYAPGSVNAVAVTASYSAQMRAMVNDDEFSDVTFVLENESVHAHRAMLAHRCEHFAAMFRSGMRESVERCITIPNMSKHVFLLMLEYIYTDSVKVKVESAIDLYIAADLYHLERLRDMCCTVVRRNLSAENSGPLLQSASESHCHVLKEICMNYIIENFDTVSKTDGIKEVSHSLLLEILAHR